MREYERYDEEDSSDVSTKKLWIYLIIMLYLIFGVVPTMKFFDRLENPDDIQRLNNGEIFYCTSGGGIYSSGSIFVVSKDRGWSDYKGDYFIKDDLIVEIIRCQTK